LSISSLLLLLSSTSVTSEDITARLRLLETAILEVCPHILQTNGEWIEHKDNQTQSSYTWNGRDIFGIRIAVSSDINVRFDLKQVEGRSKKCVIDSLYTDEEDPRQLYANAAFNFIKSKSHKSNIIDILKERKQISLLVEDKVSGKPLRILANYHSFKDSKNAIWFYVSYPEILDNK